MVNYCPECGARVDALRPFQCQACETWQWSNSKPCAAVLLECQGKVLLLRRAFEPWTGYWDIPGGFCEGGEHPQDAARRELLEETGVDVELVGLLGVWMDEYIGTDTTLNLYYVASTPELPDLTIDESEASESGWFGPGELPEMGFPNHQPAVVAQWAALATGQATLGPLSAV